MERIEKATEIPAALPEYPELKHIFGSLSYRPVYEVL